MSNLQPLSAKLGEIKFRQKLVAQHLGEKEFFPHEPDQIEIIRLLKERVNKTRKIFKSLKRQGVPLSPFLELGAEKTQRSMVLVNDFKAQGFAADISWESLESASRFLKPLGFKNLPQRICCDVYHLPFRNDSFAFVFCFETLHHFPDPLPVLKEIKRILVPGGFFYLDEEPIKQLFNFRIWRRPNKLRPWEKILKYLGVLPFVSTIGKTEANHGIIEGEFGMGTWKKALSIFEEVKATVEPVFWGPESQLAKKGSSGWSTLSPLTGFLIALEGGGIRALCQTKKMARPAGAREPSAQNLSRLLACPDCNRGQKLNFSETKKAFLCPFCDRFFKKREGVSMFLPQEQEKAGYGRN